LAVRIVCYVLKHGHRLLLLAYYTKQQSCVCGVAHEKSMAGPCRVALAVLGALFYTHWLNYPWGRHDHTLKRKPM